MNQPDLGSPDVPPQPTSQRAMLAHYFGLDRDAHLRPSWWADLLWIVPVWAVLVGLTLSSSGGIATILVVSVVALLAYAVGLRVRFLRRLDEHGVDEAGHPARGPRRR